jgi:hypothetical protein
MWNQLDKHFLLFAKTLRFFSFFAISKCRMEMDNQGWISQKLGAWHKAHPNLGENAISWVCKVQLHSAKFEKKDERRAQILSAGHKLLYEIHLRPNVAKK